MTDTKGGMTPLGLFVVPCLAGRESGPDQTGFDQKPVGASKWGVCNELEIQGKWFGLDARYNGRVQAESFHD